MQWKDVEGELRARLKATQYGAKGELARQLDITPTHLSQLISGKRPFTRDNAEKVASLYGMEISYGLSGAEK